MPSNLFGMCFDAPENDNRKLLFPTFIECILIRLICERLVENIVLYTEKSASKINIILKWHWGAMRVLNFVFCFVDDQPLCHYWAINNHYHHLNANLHR